MALNAQELVNRISPAVGGGYALGSQGEILTIERLAQLVRWNGRSSYYFAGYSAERWLDKRCWDCSGLVVWAMQQLGIWKATEDYKAQGLWSNKVTPIAAGQLQPGSLCFHWDAAAARMSHVGVYLGNGKVQEAKGTKYGVVISALPRMQGRAGAEGPDQPGSWTHYGNLKDLAYAEVADVPPAHPLIYKGSRGDEVRLAQQLVNGKMAGTRGYVPLEEDGIFGKLTDAAARAFQKKAGLVVDGEVGPKTWAALEAK